MLVRSSFKTTPVRQLAAAYTETNYKSHPDITALASKRTRSLMTSDTSELLQNRAKNCQQARGSMKFRRPERAFATAIASDIISKRYKLDKIPVDSHLGKKTMRVGADTFGKRKDPKCSIDISGICSTTQATSWFSPCQENSGLPSADLKMMDDAYTAKDVGLCELGFLNTIVDAGIFIVFRKLKGKFPIKGWHVGLFHYRESSAVAWPVTLAPVPGHVDTKYIVFDMDLKEPRFINLVSWKDVTAVEYEVHSWSWQCENFPNAKGVWPPAAARGIIVKKERPLDEVVPENGWYDYDGADLQRFAKHFGWGLDAVTCDIDLLVAMIQNSLPKASNEETMSWLRPRLRGNAYSDPDCVDILLDVDEAAKCLLRDEEQLVRKEQEASTRSKASRRAFHDAYRKKCRELKLGGGPAAKKRKPPEKIMIADNFEMAEQRVIKIFMPPQSCLWKSRGTQDWKAQVKDWPHEISRRCSKYGEDRAVRLVISEAWYQYLTLRGEDYGSAGVEGLVGLDEVLR